MESESHVEQLVLAQIQQMQDNLTREGLPMFFDAGQERGIIVGNAEERLVEAHRERPRPEHYLAKGFAADAIVEGLRHFGLAPAAPAKL